MAGVRDTGVETYIQEAPPYRRGVITVVQSVCVCVFSIDVALC